MFSLTAIEWPELSVIQGLLPAVGIFAFVSSF